ncbi:hypothetical protein JCM10449v2_001729 [Rhodotorula kratochvilovae]
MATDAEWTALLAWLATFPNYVDPEQNVKLVHNAAGRGLVARGDAKPNTLLISIPHSALLNLRTLRPLYPKAFHTLSATQLLSLHLARQFRRHLPSPSPGRGRSNSKDAHDKWWPFLATLPRAFATVPLWWAVHARGADALAAAYPLVPVEGEKGRGRASPVKGEDISLVRLAKENADVRAERKKRARRYEELLELLPHAVRRKAEEIERRFEEDWLAARRVWNAQSDVGGDWGILDFLLGFLNVNTRCIWFNVGGAKDDNLTLCPVIDMINHSSQRDTKPEARLSSLTFSSPSTTSTDPPLRNGDELTFSYGPRSDPTLLAEYGFVVGVANEHNEVEIDRSVEALFDAQGKEGALKREILEEKDYWGKMTLQSTPGETPTADWRVLIALRLLHLRLPSYATTPAMARDALAPWQHVVDGAAERVSPANEKVVQATLRGVCGTIACEAEKGLDRCGEVRRRWEKEKGVGEEERASLGMLEAVWREEARIVKAVGEVQ